MKFDENSLSELKITAINVGKLLFDKNYIAACDGNISFKYENKIYITRSGSYLWGLDNTDFAVVDLDGRLIFGEPSSELPLHLRIYRHSDATAVIHVHPVHAIAFSLLSNDYGCIPDNILSELAICAGNVPIVKFSQPGTEAIADSIQKHIGHSKNIILAKHGAISYGDSLQEAFFGINRVDHTCEVLIKAMSCGELSEIDSADVEKLWEIRKIVGNVSR
jgi:L-fuculose-phosphate aldolase